MHAPAVLVATPTGQCDEMAHLLRGEGATAVDSRATGGGHAVVAASFADEKIATRLVAALRADRRRAALRPPPGGRLVAWTNATRPVVIGDGELVVCFPWSDGDRTEGRVVVEIDPGAAFGAGTHPTTRLLAAELAARLTGGEAVLDVGCGTGVLAICAAKLGAPGAQVRAIDIEPAAVTATEHNAVWNGVTGQIDVSATPADEFTGAYGAIVANIGAGPLTDLAPVLWSLLRPGGWLGLSGLSPAQLSVVAAAYPAGRVLATPRLDDWAALIIGR